MKYHKTIWILGAILFFVGCTNLDEEVFDKLPAEDFGQSEVEVNALMGSAYNTLKKYWPNNFMYLSECGGSAAVTPTRKGGDWYDGGQFRELYMHTWTAHTNMIKDSWSAASGAIGICNATIKMIGESTILSEEEKESRTIEMRGLRAFWIYTMVDYWGNVPLVTEYGTDKSLPECKSRQEVFTWLLNELKEITPKAKRPTTALYGKFTQGAGYTLLAKLYLNADAWGVKTDKENSSQNMQEVINQCNNVDGLGFYQLENNWVTNFSPSNNLSKEAIFAIPFSSQDTDDKNQLMNRTLHYKDQHTIGASFSAWNGICAQPDYVKLFDKEDPRFKQTYLIGQMYDINTGEKLITDHGFPLDHTIDVSIIKGTERDGTNWGDVNQHDGARCQKWPYERSLVDAMENDFHIFRLADIYLMKAEALIRLNQNPAEAKELVNRIRRRAYGDTNHDLPQVSLEEIALERKFEFAWEAHSRQDDIRFGSYDKPMWSASNCDRDKGEHLKLYPIPHDAWQTNQKLTQNPGYTPFK